LKAAYGVPLAPEELAVFRTIAERRSTDAARERTLG